MRQNSGEQFAGKPRDVLTFMAAGRPRPDPRPMLAIICSFIAFEAARCDAESVVTAESQG
jgi:hypothetical protein